MSNCRIEDCAADTDGFICLPHLNQVDRAIGDMQSLLHELSVAATRQANVYRANAKPLPMPEIERWNQEQRDIPAWLRSRDPQMALPQTDLMVNLPARELMWDALNTLSTWARHLAESRGVLPPSADSLIGWLMTYVDSIRFDEAAEQIHDEVTYLHLRMMSAVDRSPSRVYSGPCRSKLPTGSDCPQPLFAWPAADTIKCDGYRPDGVPMQGCGAEHDVNDRKDWMIAEFNDALLPLIVWQQALPKIYDELDWPSRTTWWRWQRTGQLLPKSNDQDVELFRGGDIIELVIREQARLSSAQVRKRRCA